MDSGRIEKFSWRRKEPTFFGSLDRCTAVEQKFTSIFFSPFLFKLLLELLIMGKRTKKANEKVVDRWNFSLRIQMKQSHSSPRMKCGINGIEPSNEFSILPKLCPIVVIFLQFSITSMFMWMLCEGIHLNNVLTVSVFKNHFKTIYFYILGWGKKKIEEKKRKKFFLSLF